MRPRFFPSWSALRAWLLKNHGAARELWVGFYKKDSGRTGITYSEALDQALCFGWIDGVRKTIDAGRYTIRFSPRRARSRWSRVNLRRFAALIAQGMVHSSGAKAFAERDQRKRDRYSYEERPRKLAPTQERKFRADKKAWSFFRAQPPYYRRVASFWVRSAVKDETRTRRLLELIESSRKGLRLGMLTGKAKGPKGES